MTRIMTGEVVRVDYRTDEITVRWTGCGINELADVDMVGRIVVIAEIGDESSRTPTDSDPDS